MADEPRIPAEVFRRVRESFGMTPPEVAQALRIGRSRYYKVEQAGGDGPPWLLLAMAGLGLIRLGRGVAELGAVLGVDPDADPPRSPSGTYAPVLPNYETDSAPAKE